MKLIKRQCNLTCGRNDRRAKLTAFILLFLFSYCLGIKNSYSNIDPNNIVTTNGTCQTSNGDEDQEIQNISIGYGEAKNISFSIKQAPLVWLTLNDGADTNVGQALLVQLIQAKKAGLRIRYKCKSIFLNGQLMGEFIARIDIRN